METPTPTRSFGGANIKGTPAMSSEKVRNDLRKLKATLDVIALQEFKWDWYWRAFESLMDTRWRSFPMSARAIANPVSGAQGLLWKKSAYRQTGFRKLPAYDFRANHSGIMDKRWVRAICLKDRQSKIKCWFVSTHFVVKGDKPDSEPRRRKFLRQNLNQLDKMLTYCGKKGHPIILELDGNFRPGSWAYTEFMEIVEKHGGRVFGEHGIEYLVVFDSKTHRVVVKRNYALRPKEFGLNTDHEVRCIDYQLKPK